MAKQLRDLGVGPDVSVGLYAERGPELIVGVLSILKAGGAYVPLDPAIPSGRLAVIAEDAGFPMVLAQRALLKNLSAGKAQVICLDAAETEHAEYDQGNLPRVAGAEHLAYVIYTSGTTGQPKGVLLTHRGLCHVYRAWEDLYNLRTEATCLLQMASCAFDVFAGEWTTQLSARSGKLVIVCPRERSCSTRPSFMNCCAASK